MARRLQLRGYRGMEILGWGFTLVGWLYVLLVTALIVYTAISQPTTWSGQSWFSLITEMVVTPILAYVILWFILAFPGLVVAAIGEALRALRDIARDAARIAAKD